MVEVWTLRTPYSGGFWLENPSRSGGVALNGYEQSVVSLAMRWRARFRVSIRTKADVLAARVMQDALQGKAGTIRVPAFDGKRLSWPIHTFAGNSTGVVLYPGVTRRKELDGTVYEDPAIPPVSQIAAEVHANAALRATSLEVRVTQGGVLLPGQFFSRDGHLYRIRSFTGPDVDGDYTLSIMPPLRVALTTGQALNFTRADCEMRQVSDDQGIAELDSLRFADLTFEFVEAFGV